MYGFTKFNMEYIFRELDDDKDGWPEGLGNVERSGMGWGSFQRKNNQRQRQMAAAAPPESMMPVVSDELAEAAEKFGLSTLEAAAYDRLGVSLV
jgi:hypothetical protein